MSLWNPRVRREYSEDMFEDTRMSIPDHIEDLRNHLIRAIGGFLVIVVGVFAVDGLGALIEWPNFGIAKPVMNWIKQPAEDGMRAFYDKRVRAAKKKYEDQNAAFAAGDVPAGAAALDVPMIFDRGQLRAALGLPGDDGPPHVGLTVTMPIGSLSASVEQLKMLDIKRPGLTTLSAQEGFVIYFKVALICGFVLASPWVFYQVWAFVAAGLYPKEKRLVHVWMPFSIALFLGGVLGCQFFVMPAAVRALLGFNEWLDIEPDLRLSEWLSLALMLPVVFGITFQTPLVMLVLSRVGIFSAADYLRHWRVAMMVMLAAAAVLTPTPDAVTMLLLAIPMFGLYMLGIWMCHRAERAEVPVEQHGEEVAV